MMEKIKSIGSILFFLGFVVLLISCEKSTTPVSRPHINTSSILPNPTLGEFYSVTLEASGGKKPLTWSGNPPAGLKLHAKTGKISGQPEKAGSFRFDVTVTDSSKPTQYHSKRFLLTINSSSGEKLVVTTQSPLANAIVGASYKKSLQVSGANGRLTWASENLLKEFTLDQRKGIITGKPATAGRLVFDVKVVDSNQCATKRFVLPVTGLLSITNEADLAKAVVGKSYQAMISAKGGELPLAWTAESLPPGLMLSEPQGRSVNIIGAPTEHGNFSFDLKVADSATPTQNDTQKFNILIENTDPCAEGGETHQIIMDNFVFTPATLTIAKCDTVTWIHNQAGVKHTVTSDAAGEFDSRGGEDTARMENGDSFPHTFNNTGTFPYHCVVHGGPGGAGMSGTISVED